MEFLPIEVTDEERLARAIFYPEHVERDGTLKHAAFKARTGRKDVSVNRLRALSCDECKAHARAIGVPDRFAGYRGFAVVSAGTVRRLQSDVKDSRDQYCGHADILHDVALEKGVPAPPEFNHRLKQIAKEARFFPDEEPALEAWTGEDFGEAVRLVCK